MAFLNLKNLNVSEPKSLAQAYEMKNEVSAINNGNAEEQARWAVASSNL